MTKKKRFKPRRCIHCGEWYDPNPRAAARQKYCGDPECQMARRRRKGPIGTGYLSGKPTP
jgi:hypothetical protein